MCSSGTAPVGQLLQQNYAARTAPGGPGPRAQLHVLAPTCYNLKRARARAQRARRVTRAILKPARSFRAARHLAPLR
jgi:hypothetical protein